MAKRRVTLIGVPLDLGAGRRGVDMGPSAFRVAEVDAKIAQLGHVVEDWGDLPVKIQETQGPGDPRLKYLREILEVCEALRDAVGEALAAGTTPVVIGGDHSVAMGTIAGLARHLHRRKEKLGLVKIREDRVEAMCNPVAQAMPLNDAETDLNLLVDLEGKILKAPPGLKPSKETSFHLETYRLRPEIHGLAHVHPAMRAGCEQKQVPDGAWHGLRRNTKDDERWLILRSWWTSSRA